jgi:hypothetical protein
MQEAKLPSFITPMVAKFAEEPFDSPDWIFEVKLDGYRGIESSGEARRTGGATGGNKQLSKSQAQFSSQSRGANLAAPPIRLVSLAENLLRESSRSVERFGLQPVIDTIRSRFSVKSHDPSSP